MDYLCFKWIYFSTRLTKCKLTNRIRTLKKLIIILTTLATKQDGDKSGKDDVTVIYDEIIVRIDAKIVIDVVVAVIIIIIPRTS